MGSMYSNFADAPKAIITMLNRNQSLVMRGTKSVYNHSSVLEIVTWHAGTSEPLNGTVHDVKRSDYSVLKHPAVQESFSFQ